MVKKSAAFPVGLYAMLLFALAWLTLPAVFAPLERWLVGSATAVPRMASLWFGQPAAAADRDSLARIDQLGQDLRQRVERHDFAAEGMLMPIGSEKVLCGVLSASRRGGGGRLSELLLDHSYAELEGCEVIVTKGDQLIGFLMTRGMGRAVDDRADDPARVMLCNHRDAPRLYAGIDLVGDGLMQAPPLRFVVRPGSRADPAPLRVDMWDDPYRAARLDEVGLQVRTRELPFGQKRYEVPPGLSLGWARVWGYDDRESDDVLTIGVYVEPAFEPSALSHVVVWRKPGRARRSPASPLRAYRRVAAVVYDLPGAHHGRHLLVAPRDVPDGAAVVQDGLFVGTARGLCFGSGLVTSFVASRQRWSLLFLPDGDDGEPIELSGRVERSDGNAAWIRWQGPKRKELLRLTPGFLFTGSNGRFCPAGLWIGRATPDRFDRNLLEVHVPGETGPRAAEVLVGEEPR
ncbi:MAG: hypothetical protein ACE37K_03945 [Planctomycetota bacterium]